MVWINGKNVWAILAAILFCMVAGRFIKFMHTASSPKAKKIDSLSCQVIRMKVSAYCPCEKCCGEYADGKTSKGRNAWTTLGAAAAPKLLPYGTELEIPEIGTRVIDDTGGAMRQSAKKGIYHIDVRFHNHQEAKNFGVKWLDVKILN